MQSPPCEVDVEWASRFFMPNYNKLLYMGHMTRDVDVKFTQSGVAVANFCVASTHKYKTQAGEQREETTFLDCVAWGKTGEIIGGHFQKGSPIFVEGRIKTESWDDKQTGQKRSKIILNVDNFQFVGGKQEGGSSGNSQPRQQTQQKGPDPRKGETVSQQASELDDDDIPF